MATTGGGLTEALGLRGWAHLDPVLLAALATEAPVLLVGAHGTGKSLCVERVAGCLGLSFRHYNASLLNYDDLVGIPLPADDGASLRFVSTPGSVWGAQFVFFDEISRCRPDLQNKLFPIVHERRVAGIDLDTLRYRWAAMNPPSGDDALGPGSDVYFGSEPLDPALADRFEFVIAVPTWGQLGRDERRRLVIGDGGAASPLDLQDLVRRCARTVADLEPGARERVADYIVVLVDQLEAAGVRLSPRRARALGRAVVAVHAARLVLDNEADWERSAELAVVNGLPQTASEQPPGPATVLAAHKQAWKVSGLSPDDGWRHVLEEPDPTSRILVAERLGLPKLSSRAW